VEVNIYIFLTSALEGSGQLHDTVALSPGKIPLDTIDMKLAGSQNWPGIEFQSSIP